MTHKDVMSWKHHPLHWPFVRGIHRAPVDSPHKGSVTRSFDVFFDVRLNKRRNSSVAGDLRRRDANVTSL